MFNTFKYINYASEYLELVLYSYFVFILDAYEDFDITTIYRVTDMSSFKSSNGM